MCITLENLYLIFGHGNESISWHSDKRHLVLVRQFSFFVGAEVNVTDPGFGSPLYWAVLNDNTELAEHLLQKGEFNFLHFRFSVCCVMMVIANYNSITECSSTLFGSWF